MEHYHITQLGVEKKSTCGFLFGMNEVSPGLLNRKEVVVSVDLTILGGGRSDVGLLYNILGHDPLPTKVKSAVIKELKRYSQQLPTPSGAYYLQTYENGVSPELGQGRGQQHPFALGASGWGVQGLQKCAPSVS